MSDVVLSAEKHFEVLREVVWARFCGRHRRCDRDRFDEAYAEWWAREVEREASGRPSRASAPAAFVAEAVHRVLIDDARSRARGLGREDKHSLEFVDLDSQVSAAGAYDTAAQAGYEALAHRVLTLVRGRLTARELRVFVWSFLYLQSTDATAAALGLSPPRVKKDRTKIAAKVGEEVWAVLSGELDLCATYEDKRLQAVFEILTVHVEDCATCRAALGGMRRGALSIVGPAELLALSTTSEGATHALSHVFDSIVLRFNGVIHRASETLTSMPPSGRTAAAVAVAATAVAGGAATIPEKAPHRSDPAPQARKAQRPRPSSAPAARAAVAPPAATARPTATARSQATTTPAARKHRRRRSGPGPAATATPPQDPVGFEVQVPTRAKPAPVTKAPAPDPPPEEFGFERP